MHTVLNPGVQNARGHEDRRGLLWDLYVPDPGDAGDDKLFAFGHTGYTGTALRIYPEQGVYVIVLANRVHPDDSGKVGGLRRVVWETVANVLMRDTVE
jgi:CubicO group peptidase (beta-lactamase class C family)